MTIEKLIEKTNIRGQYNALVKGWGDLQYTDDELKAQLEAHVNTAVNNIVEWAKTPGIDFKVEVKNGSIYVELSIGGDKVENEYIAGAVREYLEHEIPYLWWMEYDEKYADGSARLLLIDKVRSIIRSALPAPVIPKRVMVPKVVNDTHIEWDYE